MKDFSRPIRTQRRFMYAYLVEKILADQLESRDNICRRIRKQRRYYQNNLKAEKILPDQKEDIEYISRPIRR